MDTLIRLIIYIVVFAIIGYGAWWVCVKFAMPQPVFWLVGALLLICLLLFAGQQVGLGSHTLVFPR